MSDDAKRIRENRTMENDTSSHYFQHLAQL